MAAYSNDPNNLTNIMTLARNQQELMSKNQLGSGESGKKGSLPNKAKEEKKEMSDGKIFKRASYHVAIAYHIYLDKIDKSDPSNLRNLDPSYHARKLKAEMQKEAENNNNTKS